MARSHTHQVPNVPVVPMSLRPRAVVAPSTRSLTAVLTVGARTRASERTDGVLSAAKGMLARTKEAVQCSPKCKFEKAMDERKAKNAEAAAGQLTAEQVDALVRKYSTAEDQAWDKMAKNGAKSKPDTLMRLEAQEAVLKAQLGLATLHKFASAASRPSSMPMRPIFQPSKRAREDFKPGSVQWLDLKMLRGYVDDAWAATNGESRDSLSR